MSVKTGLKKGYTTGACAAAACKGAVLMLHAGGSVKEVDIPMPRGGRVSFKIIGGVLEQGSARCGVVKDAGDDPDVTDGATIMAEAVWSEGVISIRGGPGVGVVTKPGLQVPVGEAAINPVPRLMIARAVREITEKGVELTVSVPTGEELARKTFNPKLGIVGGISIIGTTGIVEPKSVEALKISLLCSLDVARGLGYDSLVLVPGKIGERGVKLLLDLEGDRVVQTSNHIGFMLEGALERGFSKVLLCGHPGKLVKLIKGDFQTHSSRSASAAPLVFEELSRREGELTNLEPYRSLETVEGFIQELPPPICRNLFDGLAEGVQRAVEKFVDGGFQVGVILISMDGRLVGESAGTGVWREGV